MFLALRFDVAGTPRLHQHGQQPFTLDIQDVLAGGGVQDASGSAVFVNPAVMANDILAQENLLVA